MFLLATYALAYEFHYIHFFVIQDGTQDIVWIKRFQSNEIFQFRFSGSDLSFLCHNVLL